MTRNQLPKLKEQTQFFVGLGLMLCLFFYSMLRQREVAGHEYTFLATLMLAVLAFDYLKVGQFLAKVREYERERPHDAAVQSALASTLRSTVLAKLLSNELTALYYAFFAKFESGDTERKSFQFSYIKSSNAHDVYLFVALSQLPFLPLVHVFIEYKIGPGVAWLITVATLWSVVWYLAQVEAIKFRPIEITNGLLKYRFGLCWTADIPLKQIKAARSVDVAETLNINDMFLSPLGSAKNVILEFHEPVRFVGPYLQRRCEEKAAISLDDPSAFLNQLALNGVATS